MSWGLQVKPRFHQSGRVRTKATLRSWLNDKTSFFFLSPTHDVLSSTLRFVSLFVIASVVVCHSLNNESAVFFSGELTLEMQNPYRTTAFAIF